MKALRLFEIVPLWMLLVGVAIAPVAGDIGSCGQEAKDLDAYKFFAVKEQLDCQRCSECNITSNACTNACGFSPETAFPEGCYPLIHDGEVCLNALQVASCADYRGYMSDEAPTTPTECNFCPLDGGSL